MSEMNKVSLGFTGDFSFSGYFDGCYTKENLIDEKILAFLNGNDANIINFESPITPCRVKRKNEKLMYRSDPAAVDYVKKNIKAPVLSLANNHMLDYDYVGLFDTLEILDNRNIPYIGAGKNERDAARHVLVEADGFKVAVFAVQFQEVRIPTEREAGALHESLTALIKETITELKSKADKVVMVYHGGDEFFHVPMPYTRKQLKGYLDMGCDIVVAHHPHVVQGYEKFGEKYVFYSLGNFMFDTEYQRIQEDTDAGVLLRLILSEAGCEFEHLPIKIDRENRRVQCAESSEHFADIGKDYRKLWKIEATRKPQIEAGRQVILKSEEEKEEPVPINLSTIVWKLRKAVKKRFSKKKYQNAVIKYGAFVARIRGLV